MKIAYLIAAHNNYRHLQKLINALSNGDSTFYIHIDKKSLLPNVKDDKIFYIKNRVNVYWSGFSQVRATLNLMEEAIKGNHDYYAYISGVDYPIKPNTYLYEVLKKGNEYIQINKMGQDTFAPLSRYKYYYFTDYYNRRNKSAWQTKFFLSVQKLLRKCKIKKSIPYNLFTGASWFVLSKACISYILNCIETDKNYIKFFKTGFCPDESFFQTIIGNSQFYQQVKNSLTYADWSVDPGPAVISENHLPVLKTVTDKFFARKFNDDSAAVIDSIDKELRGEITATANKQV
ncbi:MAG: beta-1,6-N-acetylglucosaminyltransferase [Panacibacter sp.]